MAATIHAVRPRLRFHKQLQASVWLEMDIMVCNTTTQVGGVSVIDRQAATHNAEVDALLLVGLVAVVIGGSVLTAALLSRAFCSTTTESRPFRWWLGRE